MGQYHAGINPNDVRFGPGFGFGRRPGFGRLGFGRPGFGGPGFGFGGIGFGFPLGLLGGLALGSVLRPPVPFYPPYPYYPWY
ncbi:hypothetical protein BTR25_02415 [Bacillus sp. MRMR6]|nr:hypothetical protein BTR25_02415 [Bacillus sp. MRMR6]